MALVDVKWAPGYVYETETEISALPQEISFAMTGTRMRLVEGGAFEMGLSTQRWQEFMDRVIACAGSELPDLPPWEDSRHPRSVFGKSKDGSLCVHLPSVRDIVGHSLIASALDSTVRAPDIGMRTPQVLLLKGRP